MLPQLRSRLVQALDLRWTYAASLACSSQTGVGAAQKQFPCPSSSSSRALHTPAATDKEKVLRALSYCIQQVRTHDYEHYLCTLHLPPSLRPAIFALRAFNVETALVGESAKEQSLAVLRIVWWRDAIAALYKGTVMEHPVLQALAAVRQQHPLTKRWLDRIIEARGEDLERESPPTDIAELEAYGEKTTASLLYLCLEAAGLQSTAADHTASHVAKASSLAMRLRGTPHFAAKRKTYIPLEVLAKYKVSQEDIYRGRATEALADAVLEVASVARAHLTKAQAFQSSVPPSGVPIMLPAVPTALYLGELEKHNFNVFDPSLARGICGVSPIWLQLQLKWKSMQGTF